MQLHLLLSMDISQARCSSTQHREPCAPNQMCNSSTQQVLHVSVAAGREATSGAAGGPTTPVTKASTALHHAPEATHPTICTDACPSTTPPVEPSSSTCGQNALGFHGTMHQQQPELQVPNQMHTAACLPPLPPVTSSTRMRGMACATASSSAALSLLQPARSNWLHSASASAASTGPVSSPRRLQQSSAVLFATVGTC
jgi:hypothetical protein